jgi:hypothetical protein
MKFELLPNGLSYCGFYLPQADITERLHFSERWLNAYERYRYRRHIHAFRLGLAIVFSTLMANHKTAKPTPKPMAVPSMRSTALE